MSAIEKTIGIILSVGFISAGIFCLYQYIKFIIKGKNSFHWKKMKGVIIVSEMESDFDGDVPSAHLNIKFKFTYQGREITSSNIFYSDNGLRDRSYIKKYPIGKEVDVFYNPQNPEDCVLESGIKENVHLTLIFAIFLVMVGSLILNVAI